jgi:hypothetical protein
MEPTAVEEVGAILEAEGEMVGLAQRGLVGGVEAP